MRKYIRLLRQKVYLGFLIVLGCACLGAFRGAFKESREPFVDVTPQERALRESPDFEGPELTGTLALAAKQNRWRNFSYAIVYAGRGLVLYCILMAVYLPLYECRIFLVFRRFLEE